MRGGGKGVPKTERFDRREGKKSAFDPPIWALIKKDDSWGKQENEFWMKIRPIGANTSKQWRLRKGKEKSEKNEGLRRSGGVLPQNL